MIGMKKRVRMEGETEMKAMNSKKRIMIKKKL